MFYNVIHSRDGKAEFSAAITPVFSKTEIFCNIINALWLKLLDLINLMHPCLIKKKKTYCPHLLNSNVYYMYIVYLIRLQ